ncbi:MAG: hypothetical protein COA42_00415 [Alteromonadaceae bacterium]|nr:MAG: hypothetical protein COA42_00415 [Alteromonadaceae bacterium]
MKILGVIPARLHSQRVKEKALVDICGMPMVVHVYLRTKLCGVFDDVVVATDSQKIVDVVESYGGKAILTSDKHRNPTERLHEVSCNVDHDIIMLVNGDEPLVRPCDIELSLDTLLKSENADASILAVKFNKFNSPSDFKVVLNNRNEIMYISRSDIPSPGKNEVDYMLKAYHVMAFKRNTLKRYSELPLERVERIEEHEHIRLLVNGMKMQASVIDYECFSVDTQADLDWVRSVIPKDEIFQQYKDTKTRS